MITVDLLDELKMSEDEDDLLKSLTDDEEDKIYNNSEEDFSEDIEEAKKDIERGVKRPRLKLSNGIWKDESLKMENVFGGKQGNISIKPNEVSLGEFNEKDRRYGLHNVSEEEYKDVPMGKGPLDFSGDDYQDISNTSFEMRIPVNEEYDNLLREKVVHPEEIETRIKRLIPYPVKKERPKMYIDPEALALMKNPSRYIRRKSALIDTEAVSLDDIEKSVVTDEEYAKAPSDKKEKRVSLKVTKNRRTDIDDSDDLLEKVINMPEVYLRYSFQKLIMYSSGSFENFKYYDTVIDMDGSSLIEKRRVLSHYTAAERKRFDKIMDLVRNGNYSIKEIEDSEVKDLGMWDKIELRSAPDVRDTIKKKNALRKVDIENKKSKLSNKLGLNVNELSSLVVTPVLADNVRSNILTYNRFYKEDGKVLRLTIKDIDLLRFLGQFRWSIPSILKNLHGNTTLGILGQLERLKEMDLVNDFNVLGVGALWGLTPSANKMVGIGLSTISNRFRPRVGGISQALGVQYVASFLWNNRANVLNLMDYPYNGKVMGGKVMRGESLVSESQIRSSITYEMMAMFEKYDNMKAPHPGFYIERVGQQKRDMYVQWRSFLAQGMNVPSPEFMEGLEYCWTLYPENPVRDEISHNPDLVVKRQRVDGKAQSIAIEVERKISEPEEYRDLFETYKRDMETYSHVVWITSSSSNAKRIQRGARMAGFKDYKVLPFINEHGGVVINDYWDFVKM